MENSNDALKFQQTIKPDFLQLSALDYSMFVGMLIISAIIGIYFGIIKKQKTATDYLLGGKNMGSIPISISLAASYTSAITLLGMPAEIYSHGTQYVMSCVAAFLTSFVIANVFLPVFYGLKLMSSFEYLSLRFNHSVRKTASLLSLSYYILTTPLVMYAPALAFNLVSGIDIKYITPLICCVCIFYTAIGGLKAVVWTDTIQFIMMNGSIFAILLLGIPHEGGLSNVWKMGEEGDRIHFIDLDPSPFTRMTLWSMSLGMGVTWMAALGVNQSSIQRFLSLPSMSEATKVLYIYCGIVVIIKALCLFSGLIMYARYKDCDPSTAGLIKSADQILPYYVLDTARNMRGLPGLFVSGIFSAALSTMSTYLNTSCGLIYNDFIINFLPSTVSEQTGSKIMKLLTVIVGSICALIVLWMDKFGNILQLSISIDGISCGAILGTFVLGMLVPRGNTKGAISGAVTSLVFMMWIVYNNSEATRNGYVKYPTKPFSVEGCNSIYNITLKNTTTFEPEKRPEDIFFLFRVSFTWYSLIGMLSMLIVAIPVSYLTESPSLEQIKPEYFSPFMQNYVTKLIKNKATPNNGIINDDQENSKILLQNVCDLNK